MWTVITGGAVALVSVVVGKLLEVWHESKRRAERRQERLHGSRQRAYVDSLRIMESVFRDAFEEGDWDRDDMHNHLSEQLDVVLIDVRVLGSADVVPYGENAADSLRLMMAGYSAPGEPQTPHQLARAAIDEYCAAIRRDLSVDIRRPRP